MSRHFIGGQQRNSMMACPDHDAYSLERFVQEYLRQLNGRFHLGLQSLYEQRLQPHATSQSVSAQRKQVLAEDYGQIWSSLRRIGREWTCEAVGPTVEKQLQKLIRRAKAYEQNEQKVGSLRLNSEVKTPNYIDVDIHLKPGGYANELCAHDVFAGAEYERTTYLNTNGVLGSDVSGLGKQVTQWLKATHPNIKPRRILEMGCTIGQSTTAWVEAFPLSEVYAIDVAAPVLRYAHARAESLKKRIHFSQENAENTSFPDGFFDIVVSHAMMHETSTKALRNILSESFRLLRSGGLMLHNDGTPFRDLDPIDRFVPDWDTHYNAEPFITKMRSLDLAKYATVAGWPDGSTCNTYAIAHGHDQSGSQPIGGAAYLLVGNKP